MNHNIKTAILFFILFFIYCYSYAQITGTIKLSDTITKSEIFENREDFNTTLNKEVNKLHSNGYIQAAIDSIIAKNNSLLAIIYKGERFVWHSYKLLFPQKETFKLPQFRFKKGKPVDINKIKKYQKKTINTLENDGYPFASLTPETYINGDSLTYKLKVDLGKAYKFDSIIFNKFKISRSFLEGYLNIKRGEPYNEEAFQRIPEKIEQLSFLGLKTNPSITFGRGLARTQLNLEEKKSNYFNGLVGIVPDPDNENKYLITGDIDLTLNNAIGKGEQLYLNWKKNDRYSQELDAALKWPYIFKLPLGFDGQLKMLKQDTSYLDVESRTGIFIYFNGANTATGYYKNKQTIVLNPSDSLAIRKSNTYGTGLALTLSKLDNYLNPSKGYKFSIDLSGGRRFTYDSLNKEIKAGYIDGKLRLEGFIPVLKDWTINIRHVYSGIYSDKQLFINEYLRTGGLKSFRGFDENEFLSTSYNISTLEFRWLFENLSHVKVFTDLGSIKTKQDDNSHILKALGIGTGLNLHTNAGIFSISYALGRYHNTKIRLDNAKIHFGYINSF